MPTIIDVLRSLCPWIRSDNMSEEQFQELLKKLEELNAKVEDVAQKSYDKGFNDGKAQGDAEGFQRGFEEGYAKGKEDGLKECPTSDKIYSEEELQAKLKEAVDPLNAKIVEQEVMIAAQGSKIAEQEAKIAELEAKVGEIDQKVQEAISNFKATVRDHLADVNQDLQ